MIIYILLGILISVLIYEIISLRILSRKIHRMKTYDIDEIRKMAEEKRPVRYNFFDEADSGDIDFQEGFIEGYLLAKQEYIDYISDYE